MEQNLLATTLVDAVSIRDLDGWPLWVDLAKFCEKAPEPMEGFTVDLDFGRLDA
jgi:hypothetical protein